MNPECRLVIIKLMVIFGFAFTAFGLTLGIATYVVPGWYTYNASSNVTAPWEQIPRTRGIFQECSTNKGLTISPSPQFVKRYDCYDTDVGQYPTQYNASDFNYMMIIRMRQSQLILHGMSLVFALVILMIGLGIIFKWCGTQLDSTYYIKWRLFLGLVSLLIFLIMAASPSLGHALSKVENTTNYKTDNLPYNQINTQCTMDYGIMYMLAWVSAGFYLIAGMFFLVSVCLGSHLEEQKYKPRIISVDNPAFSGDADKNNQPIFLAPSGGSTFGTSYGNMTPNDTTSPGLLPRYNIS